jgi:arylsulfatase A-like enzyme
MPDYILLMHDDADADDAAWTPYLDGLRRRGLDRNTLVVVHGDHGEAFEQHPGNIGHTFFIYDENVRVPLIFALPGATPRQVRVTGVTSLIDVTPTVLDLLGLPASAEHQGVSALRPGARTSLFFTDYSLGWLGLRDGCHKYLYEIGSRRSKLFDVCRDPDERTDVSPDEAGRVARYRDRVERWAAAQRERVKG